MADWQILTNYGTDVDIIGSSRNVTGASLSSATKIDFHDEGAMSAIAGVYRFTMESSTEVSVEIVSNFDTKNPLIYSGNRTVVADGSTPNYNLLPGWAVIISGTPVTEDVFEIGPGCYWDSSNQVWYRALSIGPVIPGFATTEKELIVKNISGGSITNSMVLATNAARVENDQTATRPFFTFRLIEDLNPTADSDLDGRAVTFDNLSGSTVDILIDGSPIDVYDLAAGSLIPDGEGLGCNGTSIYKFADGTPLQGIEFILSADLAETDTATIYVSDGGDSVELATAEGSFVSGPTGITLTEDEQVDGTVTDDGEVTFRLRIKPGSSETTDLNLRSYSLRLIGDAV
jgi:hypothetical protein